MRKLYLIVFGIVLLFYVGSLLAQTASGDSCSNPAEVKSMVNPVKATPESLSPGKKYYGYDCARCHGATGNGKGEVDTGEKLPDFMNPEALTARAMGGFFAP